jgi:arsenic resistance protein ArsH
VFENPSSFPALKAEHFDVPTQDRLRAMSPFRHRPRFLMLYGSLRERSYSRFLNFEAARLLEAMGG